MIVIVMMTLKVRMISQKVAKRVALRWVDSSACPAMLMAVHQREVL